MALVLRSSKFDGFCKQHFGVSLPGTNMKTILASWLTNSKLPRSLFVLYVVGSDFPNS